MPSCLISQLIMMCSEAKGNTIYWFPTLQQFHAVAGSKGSRVQRPRFQWCDPRQYIGFTGSVSLSYECMIFTSAFHPGPSLCTYFVQCCIP